jgi:hypothetical protein
MSDWDTHLVSWGLRTITLQLSVLNTPKKADNVEQEYKNKLC